MDITENQTGTVPWSRLPFVAEGRKAWGAYMDAGVPKPYKFTTITFTLVDSRSSLNLMLKFRGNTLSDAATGSPIGLSLLRRVIEEINPCIETTLPQNAVTDGQPEIME